MKRRSQREHDLEVFHLSKTLKKGADSTLALNHPTALSNLVRSSSYKKQCTLVDLDHLNAIIHLDQTNRLAIVEPRITMEQLVHATLKVGLIPQVVPEFRAITVGGALMGAALESSSHHYGLFSDSCEWCEVVLGNGEVLICSSTLHPDLFFALTGSYGTLAIVTLIAIRLMAAKPFVHITYQTIEQPSQLLSSQALYVDAIAASPHHLIGMHATLSDKIPSLSHYTMKYPWSEWFYQHALSKEGEEELLPITDYLFRYDRGAFWMGQFLLSIKPLLLYLLRRSHSRQKLQDFLTHSPKMVMPGPLFRWLFGWAMSTRSLYRALHRVPSEEVAQTYLIQDCLIPATQVDAFLKEVEEAYDLFPIWICPVKKAACPQLLAPHSLPTEEKMVVNIGLYGIARWERGGADATANLEERLQRYRGRKALYSHSYYTQETFWSIYDKASYEQLRQTYHAEKTFPSLTDKVLSS